MGAAPVDPGTNYCSAVAYSTGATGVMSATGSAFVADNDLTLVASSLPTNSFAFFLVGQTQGFVPNPGGSAGNLCSGGARGRCLGSLGSTGTTGTLQYQLDLEAIPGPTSTYSLKSGDRLYFQWWHRDVTPAGQPGSNFTNGLEIDFQ